MSEGHITSQYSNHVTTIEFYHPAHNSLPGHLLSELTKAIYEAGGDKNTHIIVLKGAGERTFCAGASFTELVSISDFDTGKTFFLGFANVINAIRKCGKIVIGRIHGKAVGGGVGLAAACDYSVATKYASVRLSELAVGIGPFVIGPAVERKVGLSAFSHMAITPDDWRLAEWAKAKDLYTEVFDSTEEMDDYITQMTSYLATKSPEALSLLKKVFWEGTDHWDDLLDERAAMSGELILKDFAKNSIKAFLDNH